MVDKKAAAQLESSDEADEPEHLQYKVVVLGNGTAGKTSLIMRFCEDYFARSYKQTIGVDFFVKRLEMPEDVQVTLQVWDIGGQSLFSQMISTYIFEANAVVLTYDITNQQSFQDMEDWHDLVIKTFKGREMPQMVLIGNKVDLNHMQAVKQDVHTKFAEKNNMNAYYVSAKSGDQVSTVFYQLAADLAGITLTKPSLEIVSKTVKAEIMKHTDEEHNAGGQKSHQSKQTSTSGKKSKNSKTCAIF